MKTDAPSTSTMSTNRPSVTLQTDSRAAIGGNFAGNLRVWPAVVLAGLLWAFFLTADWIEMSMFSRFASRMLLNAAVLLCFVVWWLAFSRARWFDRIVPLCVMIAGALVAGLASDKKTMGVFAIFLAGLIWIITFWAAWLVLNKKLLRFSPAVQRIGLYALILLAWGFFDLVRWEGLDGGQHAAFAWRWSPTAEEKFLATQGAASSNAETAASPVQILPGDWPEFRGHDRNNQVHGVKLATDWEHQPPQQLWRHRVGPAWSSVIVVGGKLFTQEQRGEQECVVGYDVATGNELWAHADTTRFEEPLSRAGPRGTPTFAGGRIFSLGATGRLNCLDAASGQPLWTHDIAADAGAEIPPGPFTPRQWGYSNSPLVVDGLVVVFAGGEHNKGLLAYHADSGKPAWTYAAGKDGYSSPQLVSIGGQSQLLMHSSGGLVALEPDSGKLLWQRPAGPPTFLPITQPQLIGTDQLVTQSENGIQLVKLTLDGQQWTPTQRWDSKAMKLTLNDYVVYDGCIYGFDDNVFCCVDAETGKRHWKAGRYGSGQVLLLPDQPLLVVVTETGEAVLISPNPTKLDELARFQAIEGKTWNHPVIAQGKLFVRNAEEMACYELPLATGQSATAQSAAVQSAAVQSAAVQ